MSSTLTDFYAETAFKIISKGSTEVILMRLLDPSRNWIMSFGVNSTGKLIHKRHSAGALTTSSSVVPSLGAWHLLRAHLRIDGPTSTVEVWLDGVRIDALAKSFDLGTAGARHLQLGDSTSSRTFDIVFDDVTVDAS
jgi:hypothetical protein